MAPTFAPILTDASPVPIEEKFTLGKKLGQGAFGTVYLVQSLEDENKLYACKTIAKSRLTLPNHFDDVRKEVLIMSKLMTNKNVVQLVETFEDADHVYIVMELCSGGELFDRIIQKGHYSEADAATLIRTMLKVVAACHQNDIIHRDLKPENFLLDGPSDDAELKATDFGLSVICKRGGVCNEQVGTPVYVAPEVLRGEYNHKSDIWSLGVILYILLSGRPPFYGRTDREELKSTLRGVYDLERNPWPTISQEAKDVVKSMLTMDYHKRPEVEELLENSWIREFGVASTRPLVDSVRTSMRQFAEMSKFKKRAMQFMAENLSAEEMARMQSLFQRMDVDGNGFISVQEFKDAMSRSGNKVNEQELLEMIKAYDVDESGEIDYAEFITAMSNLNRLNTLENIQKAFRRFDTDGDGTITAEEILEALKDIPNIARSEAEQIIRDADKNGDGKIDFEEFFSMMKQRDELQTMTSVRGQLNTTGLQESADLS